MKLFRIISNVLGYIIVSITGILYIKSLIMEPLDNVSNIAFAAIGAIGSLSALCFTFAPLIEEEEPKKYGLYSGEKYLQSTILIILTLFLKFLFEQLTNWEFIKSIDWLITTITVIFVIFMIVLGGLSIITAALGFDYINKTLLFRYKKRPKDILKMK